MLKKHWDSRASLGVAAIAFRLGEYTKALNLYKEVIERAPDSSPTLWTGFGHCCYALGQTERARNAFVYALHGRPGHVPAIAAAAVLELAKIDYGGLNTEASTRRVMGMLSAAHELDAGSAVVAVHLSNALFWEHSAHAGVANLASTPAPARAALSRAEELAGKVLQDSAQPEQIQAEAAYTLGEFAVSVSRRGAVPARRRPLAPPRPAPPCQNKKNSLPRDRS